MFVRDAIYTSLPNPSAGLVKVPPVCLSTGFQWPHVLSGFRFHLHKLFIEKWSLERVLQKAAQTLLLHMQRLENWGLGHGNNISFFVFLLQEVIVSFQNKSSLYNAFARMQKHQPSCYCVTQVVWSYHSKMFSLFSFMTWRLLIISLPQTNLSPFTPE